MRLLASLLVFTLLVPFGAQAQSIPGGEDISVTLNPSYPRPYDRVTVTVTSNLFDLASSDIDISVNGTVVNEGNRTAVVRMGGPGTKTTVRAVVVSGADRREKQVIIAPAEVALILEADSTSHPFYPGASLVSSEGRVRLVALPDLRTSPTTKIAPESLVYTWKLGDQTLAAQSGVGRSVFVATAPARYRDAEVSLVVSTRDKALSARALITVSPVDPIVRIYRTDLLSGTIFSQALSKTFALPQAEETFRAVPYYFKKPPILSWTLNGNASGVEESLTVRSTGNTGTGVLGLSAVGEGAEARTGVTVQFGTTRRSGFFGL